MATSQPESDKEPHGSPYCSDPNCERCKALKEVQEAIRLHRPIPVRKSHRHEIEELLLIERSIERIFATERRKGSGKSRQRKLKIQP